jgi:LytS/YehU family sensor histidine kinase
MFWTLASASSAARSPLETLPYGLLAMGSAAVMGVAVWHLTGRIAWDSRSPSFYAVHGAALVVYTTLYSISWAWPELMAGRVSQALVEFRTSPIIIWNLLMGSWLYILVAGVSYAVRGHRRLRAQEVAAAEARHLAQQAQLTALRTQINPHFLFNALHSVGALMTIDVSRADIALESLGNLLRYALDADDAVPFAEEWRFTEDYLAFERLRLGDRLKVDARVEGEALAVMVPPLILQPLVENAVRHGIADRPDGGTITLRATVETGGLTLSVADDGSGDGAKDAGDGLGLGSVRGRLAALHGPRATVDIAHEDEGFKVTLRLPLQSADMDSAA